MHTGAAALQRLARDFFSGWTIQSNPSKPQQTPDQTQTTTPQSTPHHPESNNPQTTPQIAGEPLPLSDASVVAVEFSIATHDFTMHEDDPTHSDAPVLIRAGTCWGWWVAVFVLKA
jgi:hypothetical protein